MATGTLAWLRRTLGSSCICLDGDRLCSGSGELSEVGGVAAPLATRQELVEALRRFRNAGNAAVTSRGDSARELWSAACEIVEAVLLGPSQHLPEVQMEVAVRDYKASVSARGPRDSRSSAEEEVSITVRFHPGPLVGEFATRSRMGVEMILGPEVHFALLRNRAPSSSSASGADPEDPDVLRLKVAGVFFPAHREAIQLRLRLAALLRSDFNRVTAYQWWIKHKETEFPPSTSKLRRVMESMLDKSIIPLYAKEKGFWAYLLAPTAEASAFESLEFRHEGLGPENITVHAPRRPPLTPDDVELMKASDAICTEVMENDRPYCEKMARSSFNFLAMWYGKLVGQRSASANMIAKLFTAADIWGPGKAGWQKEDETWLCVDQKDVMGRTLKEQGRVIWHMPAAMDHAGELPKRPQPALPKLPQSALHPSVGGLGLGLAFGALLVALSWRADWSPLGFSSSATVATLAALTSAGWALNQKLVQACSSTPERRLTGASPEPLEALRWQDSPEDHPGLSDFVAEWKKVLDSEPVEPLVSTAAASTEVPTIPPIEWQVSRTAAYGDEMRRINRADMVRFLVAREGNIRSALALAKSVCLWRAAVRPAAVSRALIPNAIGMGLWRFAGWSLCGYPIIAMCCSSWVPSKLSSLDEWARFMGYCLEVVISTKMGSGVSRFVWIIELDAWRTEMITEMMSPSAMRRNLGLKRIFQEQIAERLGGCFLVGANRLFQYAWSLVQPMLTERTRRKVHLVGSEDRRSVLSRYIPLASLEQRLGGDFAGIYPSVSGEWATDSEGPPPPAYDPTVPDPLLGNRD